MRISAVAEVGKAIVTAEQIYSHVDGWSREVTNAAEEKATVANALATGGQRAHAKAVGMPARTSRGEPEATAITTTSGTVRRQWDHEKAITTAPRPSRDEPEAKAIATKARATQQRQRDSKKATNQ